MNERIDPSPTRQRLSDVDVARALAAVAVVALHAIGYSLSRDVTGSAAEHVDETFGTAFYHLYFVLVSLQWYVIFPFVLPLANRLRGRGAAVAALLVRHGLSLLLKATPLGPLLLGQGSWRQPSRAHSPRPVWPEQLASQGD